MPHYDIPPPQIAFDEFQPEPDMPAATLPGPVERGMTGHCSGVGKSKRSHSNRVRG